MIVSWSGLAKGTLGSGTYLCASPATAGQAQGDTGVAQKGVVGKGFLMPSAAVGRQYYVWEGGLFGTLAHGSWGSCPA